MLAALLPLIVASDGLKLTTPNLVLNGDFEKGKVNFESGYKYVEPAENALYPESQYTLTRNTRSPFVLNTAGIIPFSDHTTGKGLFMAVNGSSQYGSLVWSQPMSGLKGGETYTFSCWVAKWTSNDGNPSASLALIVDGVQIGVFNDPEQGGIWQQRSFTFVPFDSQPVVQLRNLANASLGNDFALDDIKVQYSPGVSGTRGGGPSGSPAH